MSALCPECAARLAALQAERDQLAAQVARDQAYQHFWITFGGGGLLFYLGGQGLQAAFAQQYHPAWGAVLVVAAMFFIELALSNVLCWDRGER